MVSSRWLWWAILALLIVALLWFVPQLQGEYFSPKVPAKDRPALVNEYRRTWAQIIGGFGLLLGLYFTWRRIEISQQELEATRQELEATRDQQVTERFTRAIEQLGATDDRGEKKLEIRLGGIYALERIATDSLAMTHSPGRDYITVIEVLTAYVREYAPRAPGPSDGSSDKTLPSNETTAEADEGVKQPAPLEPRRPTADIQAILDVLSRARHRFRVEYPAAEDLTRLDLHEVNLRGAYLRKAYLRRVDLREAFLISANFISADLQGAYLKGADLREAYFTGTDLRKADLRGADLREAYFLRANLRDARVTDEQLADTLSLKGATMPDGQKYEDWLKSKDQEENKKSRRSS